MVITLVIKIGEGIVEKIAFSNLYKLLVNYSVISIALYKSSFLKFTTYILAIP